MAAAVLPVCLAAGCSFQEKTPFHISSNVPASVYVGGEYRGETPLTVEMSGGKRHTLTLIKTGYVSAEMETKPSVVKTRMMSSLSGDDPLSAVPVAFDYETYCSALGGRDLFEVSSMCVSMPGTTGYAAYVAANAATFAVTFPTATAPYLAVEYEPQQIYVQLKKSGSAAFDDTRMWMIKRYVLRNFKNNGSDFFAGLQVLTDTPAIFWEIVLPQTATPDTAVNAVERELAGMAEISGFVKENLKENEGGTKIDDAFLTRLSALTGVEKKTLKNGLKPYPSPDEAAHGAVRIGQVYRAFSMYAEEKRPAFKKERDRRALLKMAGLESLHPEHHPNAYDRMYTDIESLSEKGRLAQNFAAAAVKAAEISPLFASLKEKAGKTIDRDDVRKLSELSGIPQEDFENPFIAKNALASHTVEKAVASVIVQDRLRDFVRRNYAKNVSGGKVDRDFARTVAGFLPRAADVPVDGVRKRLAEFRSPESAADAVVREYKRGQGGKSSPRD